MDSLFSDFDSFSESSSSDDQDDLEFPYDGHASSILSSLEETLGKIDDFLSFERGFVPGDVVSSIKDPSGQMGKVIDVDILVDLENIHGGKVQNVNSKTLKRMRSISVGDFVVNGAWLGKVEKIVDDCVTVLFDDGTKSEFTGSGLENLIPTSPELLEDSQYPFFPGQRVQLTSSLVTKSPRWLCGIKKDIKKQGTVCSVDTALVYVDWLSCAVVNCEKALPCCQDSKNLTLLSCFSHANWQLGDWCLIPVIGRRSFKGQKFLDAPACGLVKGEEQLERVLQKGNSNLDEIAVITKMKITVDVLWQDGSCSIALDSHSLLPVSITDAHDFGPGQFVLEKGICDDSTVPSIQRWGIVKCVDAKERTVKVKWCSIAMDQPKSVTLQETEEIVSAYELTEHPDYSYCLGDAVFQHKFHCTKQSDENVYHNHLTSTVVAGTESDLKYTDNFKDIKECCQSSFLSCIGIVIGLKDGYVEVTWASGVTNKVSPHEIYRVEKCEVSSNTGVHYSENSEQPREWSTVPDNQFLEQRAKDELGFKGCNEDEDSPKKLLGSSSYSFPQAAMGLLKSISSTLFGSMSTSLFGTYKNLSENGNNQVEVLELCSIYTVDTPVVNYLGTSGETDSLQKVSKGEEERDDTPTLNKEHHEYFRQFDMVNDSADHHFAGGAGKGPLFSQIKRGWMKKVQQEWTILAKDLPETIYVRVYEERMDLLRTAIVGAPGTPYHDNLFFFDIFLSPEYPHEPPMIYYNSGGLRINPNLYESGKVCLSLLNTWTGSGSEVWNPENSTILQVLLSLQALVLNEKPYFNEAGYDSQIGKAEGEKNSVCYNENAFLMSCKSMLYLLHNPPKHFEALVEEHFSQRCKHILSSCKAYMEGAPVGSAFVNEKVDQAPKNGSSTGFKIMLAKLYPKLVEAFAEKGMDCSNFLDQNE